jgi:hypothetical protein
MDEGVEGQASRLSGNDRRHERETMNMSFDPGVTRWSAFQAKSDEAAQQGSTYDG